MRGECCKTFHMKVLIWNVRKIGKVEKHREFRAQEADSIDRWILAFKVERL